MYQQGIIVPFTWRTKRNLSVFVIVWIHTQIQIIELSSLHQNNHHHTIYVLLALAILFFNLQPNQRSHSNKETLSLFARLVQKIIIKHNKQQTVNANQKQPPDSHHQSYSSIHTQLNIRIINAMWVCGFTHHFNPISDNNKNLHIELEVMHFFWFVFGRSKMDLKTCDWNIMDKAIAYI